MRAPPKNCGTASRRSAVCPARRRMTHRVCFLPCEHSSSCWLLPAILLFILSCSNSHTQHTRGSSTTTMLFAHQAQRVLPTRAAGRHQGPVRHSVVAHASKEEKKDAASGQQPRAAGNDSPASTSAPAAPPAAVPKLPKRGLFSIADTKAEVYSKAGEKFDPLKKGGR